VWSCARYVADQRAGTQASKAGRLQPELDTQWARMLAAGMGVDLGRPNLLPTAGDLWPELDAWWRRVVWDDQPCFFAWDAGGWVETHDGASSSVGDWERKT
jgi:hypothetical protein